MVHNLLKISNNYVKITTFQYLNMCRTDLVADKIWMKIMNRNEEFRWTFAIWNVTETWNATFQEINFKAHINASVIARILQPFYEMYYSKNVSFFLESSVMPNNWIQFSNCDYKVNNFYVCLTDTFFMTHWQPTFKFHINKLCTIMIHHTHLEYKMNILLLTPL
jgi:hypothetical protein